MTLKERLSQDMKAAMKAKDQATLRTVRSLKAEIMKAEVAENQTGALTEADEMKILMKAAKQRKDAVAQYTENGREDLASTEKEELAVLERYLPQQMTGAELEAKIKEIIESVGASSMKDMGKVMGTASKQLAGQADGKEMSSIVKKLLA
ncbi:MAG: GatB/YqeY domain-containing protein [Bacteroidota bacterium]